jgi:hypothetical protein
MDEQNPPHVDALDMYGPGRSLSLGEAVIEALRSSLPCEEKRTGISAGTSLRGEDSALKDMAEAEVSVHLGAPPKENSASKVAEGDKSPVNRGAGYNLQPEPHETEHQEKAYVASHLSSRLLEGDVFTVTDPEHPALGVDDVVRIGLEVVVSRHLSSLSSRRIASIA